MSLWKKINYILLVLISSPQSRLFKNLTAHQEASSCSRKKASLTVESAVVIPLATGFLAIILFLFPILQVQVAVDEALMYAGRKVATESSFIDSEFVLFATAEVLLAQALEESGVVEDYVENGFWGISLWGSDFSGNDIILQAHYEVKLPVEFFGMDSISLFSQNRFRKWTGDTIAGEDDGESVYITAYGTVYHSSISCQTLSLTINKSSLSQIENVRGKDGQKYYECSSCKEETSGETVYYTDYGTLYHGNISCSSLKRSASKISIEEVGDRKPCSFCY